SPLFPTRRSSDLTQGLWTALILALFSAVILQILSLPEPLRWTMAPPWRWLVQPILAMVAMTFSSTLMIGTSLQQGWVRGLRVLLQQESSAWEIIQGLLFLMGRISMSPVPGL